jgi:hypothetical protein
MLAIVGHPAPIREFVGIAKVSGRLSHVADDLYVSFIA